MSFRKCINYFCYCIAFVYILFSCDLALSGDEGQSSEDINTPQNVPQGTRVIDMSVKPTNGLVQSGDNAEEIYFKQVSSGENISLTAPADCDIWYLWTNSSSSSVARPGSAQGILSSLIPPVKSLSASEKKEVFQKKCDYSDFDLSLLGYEVCDDGVLRPIDYIDNNGIKDASYPPKSEIFYYCSVNDSTAQVSADLVYDSGYIDTLNGKRRLLIYNDNNTVNLSSEDGKVNFNIAVMADTFLRKGYDNDIYDKLTEVFGNDIGKRNYEWQQSKKSNSEYKNLIHASDVITILLCDINNNGYGQGGVLGYYSPGDYLQKGLSASSSSLLGISSNKSNGRPLVTLDVYYALNGIFEGAGGNSISTYLGLGLTTLAHEFQHLCHDQYFAQDLKTYTGSYLNTPIEKPPFLTEVFSSITETYFANYLDMRYEEYAKEHWKGINPVICEGPFGVRGDGYNSQKKYCERPTFYLNGQSSTSLNTWGSGNEGTARNYGLAASLGHYILVNYGAQAIKAYNICEEQDMGDINGVVSAINRQYSNANLTLGSFMRNWGIATMLSNVENLKSPYACNKGGWYEVNGMKIPSVNYWNYSNNTANNYGFISSTDNSVNGYTNSPVLMRTNVSSGNVYEALAPTWDNDKLLLTVIAVPKGV